MQASPHQSSSAPNPLSMSLWNLLCPVVWSHFEAGRGHLQTIPTKHEIVQNILVCWSIKISIYWKWPSPPKKTKKKQPSSMKLYTWNNAVWQILFSWQLTKPRLSIGLPDGEAWFVTSVNRLCALHHCIVGYFTCKTTLTYVCRGALSMGWTSLFFLSEGVTGSGVLGKIIWISLINLLQQGWQCCSICYSVSPWLISDLLSCAFKSFLCVCVSFLSVLPKRECVLPGVAQSWLPQESRLPTLKNKINQTLKELRTRPCKNLEEELATLPPYCILEVLHWNFVVAHLLPLLYF